MLKSFSIKQLVFVALSGALLFSVAFLIGVGLIALTGTPLVGGLISSVFLAFLIGTFLLILRKFGTGTLILLIMSILAIPTIIFGPPGIYKIVVSMSLGLFIDILLYFGRYKKVSYYVGVILGFILLPFVQLLFMYWLDLPGYDKVVKLVFVLSGVYALESLIGMWLASLVYEKKLKNYNIVKQIQN